MAILYCIFLGENVGRCVIAGDIDKTKKVIGDTSKLTGNAVYGHTIMNKDRHRSVSFCGIDKASKLINDPLFLEIEEFEGKCFEVY